MTPENLVVPSLFVLPVSMKSIVDFIEISNKDQLKFPPQVY